ncbi:MAG: OOP family OmpA-OmpF porin [Bacteroidia bacterium]
MKISSVLVLLLVISGSIFGQEAPPRPEELNMRKLKGLATNALRLGDNYSALIYYKEWGKRKPNDAKVSFQLAELHQSARDYVRAADAYYNCIRVAGDRFPIALYHLGNMQMQSGNYNDAKKNFSKFKRFANDMNDKWYKKLVKIKIEGCLLAIELSDSVNTAEVDHLDSSINKAHIEFSPIPIDTATLIYGSLKSDEVDFYSVEEIDSSQIPTRKLYLAKKENGKWSSAGEYSDPTGEQYHHVGNGALSQDGQRFFFTQCRKNWQNKVICHLYISEKNGDNWGEPLKMNEEINLPNYTTTQPTVGRESKRNQEVIYFVSDRPGGKGGLDIWYTEYHARKKIWKTPKNAGAKLNTPGMEFTPYYELATRSLYFSTDGRPGLGGLDVFQIEGEKTKWNKDSVVHMGKAVNSPADDFDFVLNRDRDSGFLVSNRKGGVALMNGTCCDDIYSFRFVEYVDVMLKGLVIDSSDCLNEVEVFLYMKDPETGGNYLSEHLKVNPCTFQFKLQPGREYRIEAKKKGYFNDAIDVTTVGKTPADTLEVELQLLPIPNKPIVLEGILYEFDSAELTPSAMECIDTGLYAIMIDNPQIIIELGSHTDSKGSDPYNLSLSDRRAESCVKYLIKKGIDQKRLLHKGYGETVPVAPNAHPDGTDNPEGRALNRRTEFTILGELSEDEYLPEQED